MREAAGVGLRDELALLQPPRKGATVLTQPHRLKARGEQTNVVSWAVPSASLCACMCCVCRDLSLGGGLHLPTSGTGLPPGPGTCLWSPEQATGVCVCMLAGAYPMETQCHVCTCRCLLDSCVIKPKS